MSSEAFSAAEASGPLVLEKVLTSTNAQPSGRSNWIPKYSFLYVSASAIALAEEALSEAAEALALEAAALAAGELAADALAALADALLADALPLLEAALEDALPPHAVSTKASANVIANATIFTIAFIIILPLEP